MKFTSIVCALIGLSAASALECERLFARPNIYKISQERLDRYLNAVKKLNEGPHDLEGIPHALIHNGIGEEFQGHASPADPLFMSHHAFMDKIWFDRQNRLTETTLEYPLKDNAWVMGYNKQIWQAYDPFGMCYTYVPDNFSWENVRMQRSDAIDDIEIEPYVPLTYSNSTRSGVPTEEEKQEHARKYITEGIIAPDVNNGPEKCLDGTPTSPVGKILDYSFIAQMQYDESKLRTKQRKAALITSEANNMCLA
ncbi:hypothetical protein CONCODRAFT_71093 [Conidiobolus coronatus NRRL 28638]|uniref:Tyrosinase copper-binding domain-containing protein n=1 Tax=Conidiobolus coronatus (strain ATCC 28846 / CBS 209.66 / NRRL 28638) TaxID=796925 RepID=A0A137P4T8_CONC2|nr:hypothetical protein CONCODRAFT_71093 [Conidiobolus coronatus NRRL 28638]|eukprot:KXN69934.1 hypothetical protein CONCODRAFT_71093 [Conidiobolus coronatus NRRL 28638]